MKPLTCAGAVLLAVSAMAAEKQTIPLQPAGSSAFAPGLEHDATTAKDKAVAGKRVIRLTNVSDPTLTFYPAPVAHNSGAAVIVFPGGGYRDMYRSNTVPVAGFTSNSAGKVDSMLYNAFFTVSLVY